MILLFENEEELKSVEHTLMVSYDNILSSFHVAEFKVSHRKSIKYDCITNLSILYHENFTSMWKGYDQLKKIYNFCLKDTDNELEHYVDSDFKNKFNSLQPCDNDISHRFGNERFERIRKEREYYAIYQVDFKNAFESSAQKCPISSRQILALEYLCFTKHSLSIYTDLDNLNTVTKWKSDYSDSILTPRLEISEHIRNDIFLSIAYTLNAFKSKRSSLHEYCTENCYLINPETLEKRIQKFISKPCLNCISTVETACHYELDVLSDIIGLDTRKVSSFYKHLDKTLPTAHNPLDIFVFDSKFKITACHEAIRYLDEHRVSEKDKSYQNFMTEIFKTVIMIQVPNTAAYLTKYIFGKITKKTFEQMDEKSLNATLKLVSKLVDKYNNEINSLARKHLKWIYTRYVDHAEYLTKQCNHNKHTVTAIDLLLDDINWLIKNASDLPSEHYSYFDTKGLPKNTNHLLCYTVLKDSFFNVSDKMRMRSKDKTINFIKKLIESTND